MMKLIDDWRIILLLCFTLGLAPFFPEPHIFGKLRWLFGGAIDMTVKDYFDVLLHGFPFVLLVRLFYVNMIKQTNSNAK